MKKAVTLAAAVAVAALAVAFVPRPNAASDVEIVQSELDAQINARLHARLAKVIKEQRQARSQGTELATR
jgi:ribosome-binding ATPase YchF (GTP1/OBG family)